MRNLNEDKMVPIVLDLNAAKSGNLQEGGPLRILGWAVENILKKMFGSGGAVPVEVRGTPGQVNSFTKVLASEKNYMQNWQKYGLDDPKTYKSKGFLQKSINGFERATGLRWPFSR
tara:strand:- start:1680 stop:2027 length:348 start_codon:yes stop_codon:yes gene_type:complete